MRKYLAIESTIISFAKSILFFIKIPIKYYIHALDIINLE